MSSLSTRRFLSTTIPLNINLSHPTIIIWGSNTGVGKTLISTGLAASSLLTKPSSKFTYIKPVQTGFPTDSDSRFLYRKVLELFLNRKLSTTLYASNNVLKVSDAARKDELVGELGFYEEKLVGEGGGKGKLELVCETICAWNEAVSPHLAVEREGGGVSDSVLMEMLGKCLRNGLRREEDVYEREDVLSVVETAGGVASPGPSGSLQCNLYRPLRLPAVLVGDGRLGGISGTVSAYETLKLRGYDVVAIALEDRGLTNEMSLRSYLGNRVPVLVLPPIPQDSSDDLIQWFNESQDVFTSLRELIVTGFTDRLQRLHDMPKIASDVIWWPFTQHKLVSEEKVTVIDSRCGEQFAVFKSQDKNIDFITHQFDACASWWTQGPDLNLQTELARDMGYTAARYGHVMFPENIYEPALECSELLLQGVGEGWASRVFFSDNGSTAIEIALKMAFRKFYADHKSFIDDMGDKSSANSINFKVLALSGSYHGDTLGAMEAQAPSPYTGFLQQPWYTGRGIFLKPPTVSLSDGNWKINLPNDMQSKIDDNIIFSSRDQVFQQSRESTAVAKCYELYISNVLLTSQNNQLSQIGALIIEPVIHAAGGMHMIDPLFQRVLVNECRKRQIPIIFDEVFTGFWRLGVESTVQLLGCVPDIACYAKLLTGGIIPLAVTLATDAIFDSFVDDSKLKALLHGHSYTAHAMGCAAACKAIKWFKDPSSNFNITSDGRALRELWDTKLVSQISSHPAVERVIALGTLFALELEVGDNNGGYASLHASSIIMKLREDGVYMRPLGNVIYLMCGPCTSPEICSALLMKLYARLEDFKQIKSSTEA